MIADIGCGDAQIAQDLSQKGYKVISYDLVSVNEWVVAAQCAGVIPLPGSGDDKKTHAAVVDIAVCCLSLMGTDWIKQIQEARRVLKAKGQLKVAEVTSRFGKGGPSAFAKAVESVGFKLLKQVRNILIIATQIPSPRLLHTPSKAFVSRKRQTRISPSLITSACRVRVIC